jgi:uncharacterized phage protein (predicted DNA packaging)
MSKASEITKDDIKNYLRIDLDFINDDTLITSILASGKSYIKGYTGLDDATIDTHEDITIALFVLCSEMYDNRQYTVQNDKVNPIIKSILDMYSINLL